MKQKTKIKAEDGKQELIITREFDLPLELLFKAYTEPELVEQWMGTKVLKLENKNHGSYRFETSYNGNVVFTAHGTHMAMGDYAAKAIAGPSFQILFIILSWYFRPVDRKL